MTDSVFRTAQVEAPAKEVKPANKPITDSGSPVVTHAPELLATYQDDMGKPYVAQYLDIENIWDREENLTNEINTIEGYLREQIKKGKLENSTKSGEKFLKELEKKAGTNPYESATKRIQRILAYIEFRNVVDE